MQFAPQVVRPRLIASAGLGAWRTVLIRGGTGTGKSALLHQIAMQSVSPAMVTLTSSVTAGEFEHLLRNELRTTGRPLDGELLCDGLRHGTYEVFRHIEPITLLIDGIEHLDSPTMSSLAGLAGAGDTDRRVVLAGRTLRKELDRFMLDAGVAISEPGDRFFNVAEIDEALAHLEIVSDLPLASELFELTSGWPLAVSRVMAAMSSGSDAHAALLGVQQRPAAVADLCEQFVSELDVEQDSHLCTLSQLPVFNRAVADLTGGPDFIGSLATAGVPMIAETGGWFRLPTIARTILRTRATHSAPFAAFVHLAHRGYEVEAVEALVGLGRIHEAVKLFAELSAPQLDAVEPEAITPILTIAAPAMRTNPRALLHQARIALRAADPGTVMRSLDSAREELTKSDPDLDLGLHREVVAERAYLAYQVNDLPLAQELLATVEPLLGVDEITPERAVALEARAGVLTCDGSTEGLERAALLASEAIAIWRSLNHHRRAAAATRMLSIGVLSQLGRHHEVVRVLEDQLRAGRATPYDRAMALVFLGRSLGFCGRPDEAQRMLDAAEGLAASLKLERVEAFASWKRAILASFRGDETATSHHASVAESKLGVLLDTGTGPMFWLEMAEALARCGEAERSLSFIRRAETRQDTPVDRLVAVREAHVGDPNRALELLAELDMEAIAKGLWWTVPQARWLAHRRLGNLDQAAVELAHARNEAASIGEPGLVDITDTSSTADSTGTRAADTDADAPSVAPSNLEICVLGGFELYRHGKELPTPGGNPAKLLKLLALNEGRLTIDQVVDAIWPEVSLTTGRNRIRNVVNRARNIVGDALVRDGDIISFDANVGVDITRAMDASGKVLTHADDGSAFDPAIDALSQPLLPADQYEPWVEVRQNELRFELIRLYDRKFESCISEGQIDEAAIAARGAITLDPFERGRVNHLVEALTEAGDRLAAMQLQQLAEALQEGTLIDLR